jgi:hypothetical protein
MKVSELKETIRAKVRETLYTGPNALASVVKDPAYNALPQIEKTKVTNTLRQKQSVNLEEDNIKPGEYTMAKIWKMNRDELIDFLNLPPDMARKWSDGDLLGGALEMADDKPADKESIDEEDFMDDDDSTFIEGVDDDNTDFEDYNRIYEINANVAPGSRYQIEVRKDGNFIILTQDNGQEIVVNPEDVRDLVKVILKIDNESN